MKTSKPLRSQEMSALSEILFQKTGRLLKRYLIEQAFTRSSYSKRFGGGNNENLEYIGDTILGYHTVRQLYNHYGIICRGEEECIYTFRAHEKDFTALKNVIVGNSTLAAIIDEWDVIQYLIVGKTDVDNEVDKQEKIKADLFEAIIGAYAVQYGWNQAIMEGIITRVLPVDQFILDYEKTQYRPPEFTLDNAVNTLKELAEHGECDVPKYTVTGPDSIGYDKSGNPKWICNCVVGDKGISKGVMAYSKKDAKKYVSYLVLCDLYDLPNEFGPSRFHPFWYLHNGRLTYEESDDFKITFT